MNDPVGALVSRQADVLAFERSWWSHPGGKEDAIRERFGVPATDYYRALAEIIDHPAALQHDPLLVRRLRRQRTIRRRSRSERRLSDG